MLTLLLFAASGCARSSAPGGPASITLTSPAFKDGGDLPVSYTCGGAGVSPPLAWTRPPAKTKSFAITCLDPDAPGGVFTHWLLWGIPPGTKSLLEGAVPAGAKPGKNDFGGVGYGAPCPPAGAPHHYVFTLYALDFTPDIPQGSPRGDLFAAIEGHVLGEGKLTGLYARG